MSRAKKIALTGILSACAIVLSYIESLIPVFTVPGMKIGLGNAAVLFALFALDGKYAAGISLVKITASCFMFTGLSALIYSLSGGIMSFAAMLGAKKLKCGPLGVSTAGGVFHNIGQLTAAAIAITPRAALAYAPVLLFAGAGAGLLIGICTAAVLKAGVTGRKEH